MTRVKTTMMRTMQYLHMMMMKNEGAYDYIVKLMRRTNGNKLGLLFVETSIPNQ